jgi:YVTN family beta-propeller protein
VTAEIGGTVTVFDVKTQAEIGKVHFAVKGVHADQVQPVGIRMTSDGKRAFIGLGPTNHVAVVDTHSFEVQEYILVGRRVWHMEMTPDETMLFTTNGLSGDVTVVDMATLEPIKTIKVGRFPWGVAWRP